MRLDLPSGLVLDARKIKGHELVMLAERADNSDAADLFTSLLRSCFQSVIDPGPYPFAKEGTAAPDWMRILKGDLLAAVFTLRAASIPDGDNYIFRVRCEECGKGYDWEIVSLAKDLPVKPVPETSRAAMALGNRLEAKTLSGVSVVHRLMTPSDDKPMKDFLRRIKRRTPGVVERLANQTITIDGVQGAEKDVAKRWNFFKELDLGEIRDLEAQYDAAEGGIETEIRTRCHELDGCGWEQDIVLPLRKTFFAPKKKAKTETATKGCSDSSSPG